MSAKNSAFLQSLYIATQIQIYSIHDRFKILKVFYLLSLFSCLTLVGYAKLLDFFIMGFPFILSTLTSFSLAMTECNERKFQSPWILMVEMKVL